MALTEADKKKIEEESYREKVRAEEAYRQELRSKKKRSFLSSGRFLLILLVIFAAIMVAYISDKSSQVNTSNSAPSPQPITEEYKNSLAKMFCGNRNDGRNYLNFQRFIDQTTDFEVTAVKPSPAGCMAVTEYCLNIWEKEECENIANKKIRIGMDALQLGLSWGPPKDINSTTTTNLKRSQYVYGDFGPYVYLESRTDKDSMKVTSWQD